MPDWSEVIESVARQLGFDKDVLLAQADFLQIAEYLEIKHKSGDLFRELILRFDDPSLNVAASKPHLLLPYIDSSSIFTTNWDSWIEKGFENQGVPFKKIVDRNGFLDRRATHRKRPARVIYDDRELTSIRNTFPYSTLVKFHGDFSKQDSIVFAEETYYDRMDFEDPLDLYLRSELLGRSVVFIGYSFSDQNVRLLWHRLNKILRRLNPADIPPSFFITSTESEVQTQVLRKKNIEIIQLNPTSIGADLAELLERTIEAQR